MAMSLMYGIILPTGMANIRRFWSHAFAVAMVCEEFSRRLEPAAAPAQHESAFMVGLLHDIGRAALGMRVDFSYFEREMGHLNGQKLTAVEEDFYGVSHAEAGDHLLRLWHMPESLCQAVAEHHKPYTKSRLARLCFHANLFVNRHLPEHFQFEEIVSIIKNALEEHPVDLESTFS